MFSPQIYESRPDEMNEKILCSIEKQALVQIITKELAKQLVPENYKIVASVSAKSSYTFYFDPCIAEVKSPKLMLCFYLLC